MSSTSKRLVTHTRKEEIYIADTRQTAPMVLIAPSYSGVFQPNNRIYADAIAIDSISDKTYLIDILAMTKPEVSSYPTHPHIFPSGLSSLFKPLSN